MGGDCHAILGCGDSLVRDREGEGLVGGDCHAILGCGDSLVRDRGGMGVCSSLSSLSSAASQYDARKYIAVLMSNVATIL